uniref:Uncharacterized protein n=1 Tax=Oryza punctata TaxID=4537 RepID=A0A0E0KHC2_ORYPU
MKTVVNVIHSSRLLVFPVHRYSEACSYWGFFKPKDTKTDDLGSTGRSSNDFDDAPQRPHLYVIGLHL